ncbi:hypothetical protein D3C72_1093610 [compost metagenome]
MRRGDEDGAVHLRHGREIQVGRQSRAHFFRLLALQIVFFRDGVEQGVAGVGDHQARQYAAHAVADQDHVVGRVGLGGRVELRQGRVQRLADGGVVGRQRRIARVVHLPDLVAAAQLLVAHQFIRHVDPRFRAAGQAVQHDDGALVRVIGLHQVHLRARNAVGAAEQSAQRLHAKAGTGQPQAVAGREIGRHGQFLARHARRFAARRVDQHHQQLLRGQYFLQAVAVEADQRRDDGKTRLLVRHVLAFRRPGLGHDGHQVGAEAVAPVHIAQAGKRQRGGRQQFVGQGTVVGQAQGRQFAVDLPAGDADHIAVRAVFAAVAEQIADGLLHGIVVVVADLRLAFLEGALARRARRVEQVGIRVAGRFEPGGQRFGARAAALFFFRQRAFQPQFGQGRQALLVAEQLGAGQVGAAAARIGFAGGDVAADDAQHLAGRGAQFARGENVAAPLLQVVGW